MNQANRKYPEPATVEAHTSKSAGANRKHDGKAALGIKAKLFLAFGGMAMLTVGASAVAWYAFTDIDKSVTRITAESIVGMAAPLGSIVFFGSTGPPGTSSGCSVSGAS